MRLIYMLCSIYMLGMSSIPVEAILSKVQEAGFPQLPYSVIYLRMKLSGILCTCSLIPKLSPQGEPGNEANIHAVLNPCRGYIVQGAGGGVHGVPQ